MVATLAEEGRLLRLYTQNVDGIDTALEPLATTVPLNKKGPWPRAIQLHGGLRKMVCSKCGHLSEFEGELFEGPEPPSCKECEETDGVRLAGGLRSHGIGRLRPRMVLYNEFNPDEEAIGEVSHSDLKSRPDAVIIVGTSLKVPGIRRLAKEMCAVTRGRRGGFTAWINHDPEPSGIDFKDSFDLVVKGECDEVARHVGLPKWDDKDVGDYTIVKEEDGPPRSSQVEVVVKTSNPLDIVKTQGILTPGASPRQQSPTPAKVSTKPQQTKLPFGTDSAIGKDSKPKKKRVKKPAAPKPTNQITKAFTTTKVTKLAAVKKPKNAKDLLPDIFTSQSAVAPSIFPNLNKLRPVSPTDKRTNSDYPPVKKFEIYVPTLPNEKRDEYRPSQEAYKSPYSNPQNIPKTPEMIPYDRDATISPTSVPSGMKNLLS